MNEYFIKIVDKQIILHSSPLKKYFIKLWKIQSPMEERKCSAGDGPIMMAAANSEDVTTEVPVKPQVKRVPHLHKLEK